MDYQRVKDYLEGNAEESDFEQIWEWLKGKENESLAREILGEIWARNQINLKGDKPDFEKLLSQVHHRINMDKMFVKDRSVLKQLVNSKWYVNFSRVAAILLIPLLVYTAFLSINSKSGSPSLISSSLFSSIHEIYSKPGTRTKIELSDGTKVWLNDGTTFRYPERFSKKEREVYVDGEAYFEVKSNPECPFVVKNPMVTTVVTGTHFNLNAYVDDGFFEATLLEGKIQLSRQNKKLSMVQGEQAQFDSISGKWQRRNDINAANATSWINGKLTLHNERLSVAAKKIGRWYNVEIVLRDNELSNMLLTASLEDEKLDQTLRLISLALPIKYTLKKEENKLNIQRTIFLDRK